ncbi:MULTISPECIES: helix-turn-helix domain-containing protein [Pseudomonas]|jgi:DNA-binding XRE family transcriptional regulator|uniref:helix-turn-helix domain-containing protein n=1 Tax=Pseudomonas TaxID=286 RepID=UPI00165DD9ED|nr:MULTISPECIES: helix-turn-helix domain-containing protein [Pseudomonas]MDK8264187.1 helix-turn-helix domain-containing protein [Pseudomonas oryzihabitans]QNQ97667.1 transcriptional regulator [Pseudomonas psychrotolerans]
MSLDDQERRQRTLDDIREGLQSGRLSLGAGVRRLRREITGLTQTDFARMARISLRTLRQLEQDEGNPTLATLQAVFRPFGLGMGVIPLKRR